MFCKTVLISSIPGKLSKHISGVSISNGMDWSGDKNTMYYIDSLPKKVYAFDYNEINGDISNQRVLVDFSLDERLGFPDGMCMDSRGRLWIASFFGPGITCWDPATGDKVEQIDIPVHRVTSCCFGGPNFEWLFVTSACTNVAEDEWVEFPHSGGIFVVKGLGAKGRPANQFKHSLQTLQARV